MEFFENELKDNFKEILDAMSEDLLISDGKGKILWVAASFEAVYGLHANDALGHTVYELEQQGFFKPSIHAKVIEEKQKVTMPQKTHANRDIIVTATPIFGNDGEIKFIVSFSRDITEMVELQKRYSKLQNTLTKYSAEIKALRMEKSAEANLVIASIKMERILETIHRVADLDANVLILGDSGTGKTLLAKIIHQKSRRSSGPFVDINCAAIPENLLESELFGYEKGSFTGASAQGKIGLIELANKGTLLLDEISEMPLTLQAKLLKAIQDKVITRVGGTKEIKVDFRLITASNRNLEQYSDEGKFRKDLYYRLNVVNIKIPPLAERKEEIIPLVEFFTDKFNKAYRMNKSFSPKAIDAMLEYSWPGNVRELSNAIERTLVTSTGNTISQGELPEEILAHKKKGAAYTLDDVENLQQAVESLERDLILQAYEKCGTSVGVAKMLNISQPTAFRKINKYLEHKKESSN